jgi:predicted lipid-binding transport protein (Tim44 family)
MSWHSFVHGLKHDLSKAGHAIENVGGKVLHGAEDVVGGVAGLAGGLVGGVLGGLMDGITGGLMGMNDADLGQIENLLTGGMETGMAFQIFNSFSSTMPKPDSNN